MQPTSRRRLLWSSHLLLLAIGAFAGGWGVWQAMGRGWLAPPPGTTLARPATVVIADADAATDTPAPAAPAIGAPPPGLPAAQGTPAEPVAEASASSPPAAPIASSVAAPAAAPVSGASLLIPVAGVPASQLADTFSQSRSEGRTHEAIDIMAPTGTPVHAVADGHIEKLFDSRLGGITLYQFDSAQRHAYYYAHLHGYAPGIAEKQVVKRGDLLGYVGHTGNADPGAPHLHFAVFELGPEKQWWKGTPLNPYPMLTGRGATVAESPARTVPSHRMPEGGVRALQERARGVTDKVPAGVRP